MGQGARASRQQPPPQTTPSSATPVSGSFLGRRLAADLLEQWGFFLLLPSLVERSSVQYVAAWFVAFVVMHVGLLTITGTTPFKWILGLGVRSLHGAPLNISQATIRAAVYASPILLGFIAGAIGGVNANYTGRAVSLPPMDNRLATGVGIAAAALGTGIALSVVFGLNGRGLADKAAGTAVVKIR